MFDLYSNITVLEIMRVFLCLWDMAKYVLTSYAMYMFLSAGSREQRPLVL